MPEFDPIEESLPEALRPIRPCPPLKLLLAHKEDVLPENAAAEITGHLEHCGLCRTLLADVEHLSPPGLSKREQELMRRRMPIPEAVDSTKWRWYAVSGAVAAVLLVGAFLGLRARPVQPVQTAQILQPKQSETVTPKQVQPQLEVAKLAPPWTLRPDWRCGEAVPVISRVQISLLLLLMPTKRMITLWPLTALTCWQSSFRAQTCQCSISE